MLPLRTHHLTLLEASESASVCICVEAKQTNEKRNCFVIRPRFLGSNLTGLEQNSYMVIQRKRETFSVSSASNPRSSKACHMKRKFSRCNYFTERELLVNKSSKGGLFFLKYVGDSKRNCRR